MVWGLRFGVWGLGVWGEGLRVGVSGFGVVGWNSRSGVEGWHQSVLSPSSKRNVLVSASGLRLQNSGCRLDVFGFGGEGFEVRIFG